jgi:hypothetical protein
MAFCNPCKVSGLDHDVLPFLSAHMLDLQSNHFKMTMLHNYEAILHEKNQFNPLMRLWHKISTSGVFNLNLSKYIKLVEITIVQVIGLVEKKRKSSTLAFIKNKSHNHLSTHLELCIRFHSQQLFTNFFYD